MMPTEAGFLAFLRAVVGIPAAALPDTSPSIAWAYNISLEFVLQYLIWAGGCNPAYPNVYALAVYNLAADRLVNFAQDQPGQNYFSDLRKSLNIAGFVSGVITASSDVSTSQSLEVPEAMKGLTIGQLQNLKTPWGREYLSIAQSYGPAIWGLS